MNAIFVLFFIIILTWNRLAGSLVSLIALSHQRRITPNSQFTSAINLPLSNTSYLIKAYNDYLPKQHP